MDNWKPYIGYIITIATAVGIIWQSGRYYEKNLVQSLAINKKIVTREELVQIVDSVVGVKVDKVIRRIDTLDKKQKSMEKSYVTQLKDAVFDSTITFGRFMKYMDGLEFGLTVYTPDTLNMKIRQIRK